MTVLVVLVPLVPVLAGLLLSSGGGTRAAARSNRAAPPTGSTAKLTPLVPGSGTLVAHVLHRTTIRAAAAGKPLKRFGPRTEFHSPEVMWVVRRVPGWLGVVSPLAGNGRLGWIPQSAAALSYDSYELRASLKARRLEVLFAGKVIRRYAVAVGSATAPTPTGRFDVTDRLAPPPGGPYGCCILALSGHAPHAIQGWSGGDRIAIHSTPETASIGQAVSHGCLRLSLAEGHWLMTHIPLGTPTLIRS
jgi:lipoprotein-anchoring transpeptidase ErfK/SrfK